MTRSPISIMVIYAVALHLIWSMMLILDESVAKVTAIASIRYVLPWPFSITAMLIAASLALAAFAMKDKFVAVVMMVPQQFLLFISAGGAIEAMVTGQFADGTVRPITFLIADQLPAVLTAVGHSAAIYKTSRMGWNGQ